MALLDFLRKKKKPEEKKIEKKPPEARPRAVKPRKRAPGAAWKVLQSPHVTEKATGLEGENKYVFKVLPRANKNEIKKAVESLYGVDVVDVKIINVARRKRRLGRQQGWRKGYKKAIVKVKKGQKIEIMPR